LRSLSEFLCVFVHIVFDTAARRDLSVQIFSGTRPPEPKSAGDGPWDPRLGELGATSRGRERGEKERERREREEKRKKREEKKRRGRGRKEEEREKKKKGKKSEEL